MNNTILQFINRAELEIIDQIEQRFSSIINDSIQQLKNFSNLSIEKFSTQTNSLLVQKINELSFYFWRLIEILIDYSYYIQQKQQSTNDLNKLNHIQTLLLSHIDFLNEYHQQRSQLSSNLIIEFDKKISNQLSHIANEISNQLNTIFLPNDTTSIIGDR